MVICTLAGMGIATVAIIHISYYAICSIDWGFMLLHVLCFRFRNERSKGSKSIIRILRDVHHTTGGLVVVVNKLYK